MGEINLQRGKWMQKNDNIKVFRFHTCKKPTPLEREREIERERAGLVFKRIYNKLFIGERYNQHIPTLQKALPCVQTKNEEKGQKGV